MLQAFRQPYLNTVTARVAFAGHAAIFFLLVCAMLIKANVTIPGGLVAGVPMLPIGFFVVAVGFVILMWCVSRLKNATTKTTPQSGSAEEASAQHSRGSLSGLGVSFVSRPDVTTGPLGVDYSGSSPNRGSLLECRGSATPTRRVSSSPTVMPRGSLASSVV
mmetsp:Transcript_32313/g.88593  ORF Transcript_32313/g.88593 Transcript_32313/m.88593 type:complete len:162 (+) Transcript_32313:367-852(+)